MLNFNRYDVVRIRRLPARVAAASAFDIRAPTVGDIATIVEIYADPVGYELECSDAAGITQWLDTFNPGEIDIELI